MSEFKKWQIRQQKKIQKYSESDPKKMEELKSKYWAKFDRKKQQFYEEYGTDESSDDEEDKESNADCESADEEVEKQPEIVDSKVIESEFVERKDTKDSSFVFQAQRCLLTYKTHINKKKYVKWLKEMTKRPELECHIAHENGDLTGMYKDKKTPYEHSHMVIDFKTALRNQSSKAARMFDYKDIHPHISVIKTKTNYKKALNYISKEDPDCLGLKTEANIVEGIQNCKTANDAMKKFVVRPSDALGIKLLFEERKAASYDWTLEALYPWQQQVVDIANSPTPKSSGIIHWISDPPGQGGKTSLIKHCMSVDESKYRFITQMGSSKDLAQVLFGVIAEEGWRGDCFFVNLTRNTEEYKSIYDGLEMLSDCITTSPKYKGKSFMWQPMKIIVFANYEPNISKMSKGRIKTYLLKGENGQTDRELEVFVPKEKKRFALQQQETEVENTDEENDT